MNLLKEQLNDTAKMKAKTEIYSQLLMVFNVEAETLSNTTRKFIEIHKFMNFLCETLRCLREHYLLYSL